MAEIRSIRIVTRPRVTPRFPSDLSKREFYGYDEFAEALGRHSRFDVRVIEEDLRTVGEDAFVLLHRDVREEELSDCPHAFHRTIIVNSDGPPACLERLDRLGHAGAIPRGRYSHWQHRRAKDGGGGLFGLRAVADRMGTGSLGGYMSPRYRDIYSERYRDLPELVAAYIEAFAAMWPDMAATHAGEAESR
jgi:hypothetical protein